MTPHERENRAAHEALWGCQFSLGKNGVAEEDMQAATIAVLWRALENASEGMSKETLRKMIFGDE